MCAILENVVDQMNAVLVHEKHFLGEKALKGQSASDLSNTTHSSYQARRHTPT